MQERVARAGGVVCSVQNAKVSWHLSRLTSITAEGLIPIAEVARGWIKNNFRDHIREGRRLFTTRMSTPERSHNLSLKDVNEHQRREKSVSGRMNPRQKWIGFAAEAAGHLENAKNITNALYREYGVLYAAFEDFVTEGRSSE